MNKDALTAPEVAEMLKVAQNTVYELVKRGELNCYKVGRKMRFTYDDVQEYIGHSRGAGRSPAGKQMSEPEAERPAEKKQRPVTVKQKDYSADLSVFRLCGQDEILDVLAKYMNTQSPDVHVERVHKGSYDSLVSLYKNEVIAAASHMWDAWTDTYNEPYIFKLLPGCPVVIVKVAERSQGFYVAAGNPKNITSWEDLRRRDLVIANREPGAGTRILLDEHLQKMGITGAHLAGYDKACLSHLAVAGSISKGEADLGIGTEKTALNVRGVDFVPLQMEQYDLVIKKENFQDERVQLMIRILQSEEFKEQFIYMNGYDVSRMGQIIVPEPF